jgi:serine/threonine protein kinase
MFQPVQFGKYYLYDRVAVGGMAEIFKAKMYGTDGFEKNMVVKQILPQYARNREFVEMFIDEAKITVSLSHGNIVPVFELGQIDGTYFIAMDFVDGKNLGELLDASVESNALFSIPHALFVASEILSGLDYAHRKTDERGNFLHIVHRDVSPQNILISFEGEVKIVDFGIARAATKVHATQSGVIKGKFGYMSPEQALGKDVDARSDVFAAGILLYEMLTLERLFYSETDVVTLDRIKRADVPTPSKINPKLPPQLDAIIFKSLALDPAQRYQSAGEMRLAISRFLYQLPEEASAKTLSPYLKKLFAEDLKNRSNRPPVPAPPISNPALRASSSPGAVSSSVASGPEALLVMDSDAKEKGGGNLSALEAALDPIGSVEGIEDNFSYSGFGKWLKRLLILAIIGLVGFGGYAFRKQIQVLFATVDEVMDKSTQRLAQKSLGTLLVRSRPTGASVYFDNAKVGTTDMRIADIDTSREYELILTKEGFSPFSRRILPSDWKQSDKLVIQVFKDWTSDSFK